MTGARSRRARSPAVRAPALLALALLLPSCSHVVPWRFVDERAPGPPAKTPPPPPPPVPPPPPPAPEAPAAPPRSLEDLLALALATDPTTRATWYDARAAAAQTGSRRSSYYPVIEVDAGIQRSNSVTQGGRVQFLQTVYGPSASLTWLLLDLGARSAYVRETDRLLLAAQLAQRGAVQDLVLRVETTYYQYLAARGLVDAEVAAVKQAQTSLAAAEDRRRAGLATIADVLQARTAFSQAQLNLQAAQGNALAARGTLAALVGLAPTAELDVGVLPEQVALGHAAPTIDQLLADAAANSPDLARARAVASAARAHADYVLRSIFPTLTGQLTGARSWYLPQEATANPWSAGLFLRIPIFEGFRTVYDTLAARAQADAASARADATAQSLMIQVWTSYQAIRTAAQRVETARDLVQSAQASAEVATARYKEGVGSIIDLLNAQAALEVARAQDLSSRTDWLVSVAQLARATGRLEPPRQHPPVLQGERP